MKNTNLTKILNKSHENKWVALSKNQTKVLGYSASLMDLKKNVSSKEVVYMKILPRDFSFAF
jgi:hypothetical protein